MGWACPFDLSQQWGARPSNHGKQSHEWGNTPELGEFSYNPLGNAWTISSVLRDKIGRPRAYVT